MDLLSLSEEISQYKKKLCQQEQELENLKEARWRETQDYLETLNTFVKLYLEEATEKKNIHADISPKRSKKRIKKLKSFMKQTDHFVQIISGLRMENAELRKQIHDLKISPQPDLIVISPPILEKSQPSEHSPTLLTPDSPQTPHPRSSLTTTSVPSISSSAPPSSSLPIDKGNSSTSQSQSRSPLVSGPSPSAGSSKLLGKPQFSFIKSSHSSPNQTVNRSLFKPSSPRTTPKATTEKPYRPFRRNSPAFSVGQGHPSTSPRTTQSIVGGTLSTSTTDQDLLFKSMGAIETHLLCDDSSPNFSPRFKKNLKDPSDQNLPELNRIAKENELLVLEIKELLQKKKTSFGVLRLPEGPKRRENSFRRDEREENQKDKQKDREEEKEKEAAKEKEKEKEPKEPKEPISPRDGEGRKDKTPTKERKEPEVLLGEDSGKDYFSYFGSYSVQPIARTLKPGEASPIPTSHLFAKKIAAMTKKLSTVKDNTVERTHLESFLGEQRPDMLMDGYSGEKIFPQPENSFITTLKGPYFEDEGDAGLETRVFCKSISTYPMRESGLRDGHPICDYFHISIVHDRVVISLADGCNWGQKPREAARTACNAFNDWVVQRQHFIKDTVQAKTILLEAFATAHSKIIEGKEDVFDAGTCTLLGGVLLRMDGDYSDRWIFSYAAVGDCKAFLWRSRYKMTIDITAHNRINSATCNDPGGRLGPSSSGGAPDLRNLEVFYHLCDPGDFLILVTDGVHDNLDPEFLGFQPSEVSQVDATSWAKLDREVKNNIKNKYATNLLTNFIEHIQAQQTLTPQALCTQIVAHCDEITKPSRDFMETNRNKKLPVDYKTFPGKMDHTTCVVLAIKYGR